ncbi:MAG: hypothetical protein KGM24_07845 [Elusimicrobia bacterium]|nr:hypothetical protein [Elusimicrobiota bacterium]
MRRVLAVAALALAVPAAGAGGGRAGGGLSAGSDGYREARAWASFDLPDSTYLTPRAALYRSDFLNGTEEVLGLRGGWQPGPWSVGADASLQPRVDGYERSSFGLDASLSVPLDDARRGLSLAAGGGATFTRHSDLYYAASGPGRGRARGAARGEEFAVRETDLFVFGSLRGRAGALTLRLGESLYDRDLAAADARRELAPPGSGFGAAVFGFPRTVVAVRARAEATANLEPFVSCERTTFELGDPAALSLKGGATLYRGRAALTGSFELYRQSGYADRRYVALGASLGF